MKRKLRELVSAWRFDTQVSALHPRVVVDIRTSIRAMWLKVATALVALGCILLTGPGGLVWLAGGGIILAILFSRWTAAPAVLAAVAGFSVLASEPFDTRVYALIFGVHLVFVLFGTVGDLPPDARVEASVLVDQAPRFLFIQLVTQGLAWFGANLAEREVQSQWLAIAAA